jgi:hypothetical protein
MTAAHSVKSGVDALVLTGIGFAAAAGAAAVLLFSVGLTRLALSVAVG